MEPHELSFLDWAYRPPPPPRRESHHSCVAYRSLSRLCLGKRGPYKKRKVKSAETVESSAEPEDHPSAPAEQTPTT